MDRDATLSPYSDDTVHELIQLVYLAGTRRDGWTTLLRKLCDVMNGANAVISFADRDKGGATVSASVGLSEEALQLYAAKYRLLDPFAQGTAALGPLRPGFIGLAQQLLTDEE